MNTRFDERVLNGMSVFAAIVAAGSFAAAGELLAPARSSLTSAKTAAVSTAPCCGVLAGAGVAIDPVVAGSDGVAVDGGITSVAAAACDAAGWSVDAEAVVAVPAATVTSESTDVSV